MNKYVKALSVFIIVFFVVSINPSVYTNAASSSETDAAAATASAPMSNLDKANTLKQLGLFMGSDKGFELDRQPTRIEGAVMLLRLMGKEKEALDSNYKSPFTDVPTWASKQIGYMYANGLAFGISKTKFGSNEMMSASQYVTFILRALGYNDEKDGFDVNSSLDKGFCIGLISYKEYTALNNKKYFLRDDLAGLSFNALVTKMKGSDTELVQNLINNGTLTENVVKKAELIEKAAAEKEANELVEFDNSALAIISYEEDNSNFTVYVRRRNLPAKLQNFSKIEISTISKDYADESQFRSLILDFAKAKHWEPYNSAGMGCISDSSSLCKNLVTLYDNKGNPLGYHLITDSEFNASKDCFIDCAITFEGEYNSGSPDEAKKLFRSLKELKPDIVTMDITMPEMDGIEALKGIKAYDSKAKVIMVSAMGQEPMIKEAIVSGANYFIVKPFKEDHVVETLNKILAV